MFYPEKTCRGPALVHFEREVRLLQRPRIGLPLFYSVYKRASNGLYELVLH